MSSNLPAVQSDRRFTVDEIRSVSQALSTSGLFGIKTPEQAFALALIADAEGLHPATVAQDYDVIQGRPARKTHSVLARFQAAGGTVRWLELSEKIARAEFSHPAGGTVEIKWTIDQAKQIGLTGKDNWKNYPRAMLRARCIGEGVRTVFPAAIGGMLVVEEAQDMPKMSAAPQATTGQQAEAQPALTETLLQQAEAAAEKGSKAYGDFWKATGKENRKALADEHARLKTKAEEADKRTIDVDPATGEILEGGAQ